ncbi:MAG: FtsW/RodA/SpoVE family cell cycle protein [Patescibacteria group bacterium]
MIAGLKKKFFQLNGDWLLVLAIIPLAVAGLLTMNSFTEVSFYFNRQVFWLLLSFGVMFGASMVDWRFLRQSSTVIFLYILSIIGLLILLVYSNSSGRSFSLIWFSVQPVEFVKLALIIILAKYFSRRHIEIADFRHIAISGLYAFIPFVLVFQQPDLGSAIIVFLIWLGLILISGVSKKHLFVVFMIGVVAFIAVWFGALYDYQKQRILSFIDPVADIQGAGYNANQSKIAVGSGQIMGKGLGFGSQSRLRFLPEPQTDFIFAAFAEEWGFIGSLVFFFLFGFIIYRILDNAIHGATNFEILFGVGLAIMIFSNVVIHIGMNIGVLPVTGLPLPFVSYGGSHLLAEFLGIGILLGMKRYSLAFYKGDIKNEFLGPQ